MPIEHKKIIQFSPPRSGSTLIYNILREVFPNTDIEKWHTYQNNTSHDPVVVTYRHPLDCIASSIQRYELIPTQDVIEKQVIEFNENGIWDVLKIKNKNHVLILRYEEFVNNFDKIYDAIEQHFDIIIPIDKKATITKKYQIDNIQKIVESKSTFAEYDKITHWHGKHISVYKGRPFYYQEYFQDDQIEYLKHVYRKFLEELHYT